MTESTGAGPAAPPTATVEQWILDTRKVWTEATETRQLQKVAARALALLSPEEQAGVLRYYHARDAKLSLGSHLLKRYAISRFGRAAWREATASRNTRTKPVFRHESHPGARPVAFNVSHQAGLVAMVAVHGYAPSSSYSSPAPDAAAQPRDGEAQDQEQEHEQEQNDRPDSDVEIGVDVVCTSERRVRDHGMIASDGWLRFVDVHADVLSPAEADYLKYQVLAAVPGLPHGASPEAVTDFKLRAFYALWCLREAFVKMTGDALLAAWLPRLEFRHFRPPPVPGASGSADGQETSGEAVALTEHHVVWKGRRVDDVQICLRAWGADYMTCTAVMTPRRPRDALAFELGPFREIELEEILTFAEAQM